jgi:hypothetical protein
MNLHVRLALALVPCLLSTGLTAADKIDLNRVTPVPADQPIPTQDFFRPRALSEPKINHRGSHIAALVTEGEDKHLLMVYDIAKNTTETVGGNGEKDIYNVHWLTDTRVLFQLSSRKMYGLGIMAADIGVMSRAYPLQQYNWSSVISIPLANPQFPLVWNRRHIETQRDAGVAVLNSNYQTAPIVDLSASRSGYDYMQLLSKTKTNNDRCVTRTYAMPENVGLTYNYMADKSGELAYAFASHMGAQSLLRLEGHQWVKCPVDLEEIDVVANANEPGQLLVRGPSPGGQPRPPSIHGSRYGQAGRRRPAGPAL